MIEHPDYKIDAIDMPRIAVKNIHLQNFKAFEDQYFDFMKDGEIKEFSCFFGPNGTGKTTILDTMQIIFSRFDSYDKERLRVLLGKSVRHVDGNQNGIYGDGNFLITAEIQCSLGDYTVKIDKTGFIKDHPEEVKDVLKRLYYFARYDQELHQFQLERKQWPCFKKLIEGITGYTIKESQNVFSIASEDPVQAELLEKYVLDFNIHKPDEIISCRECSAGERKIIKSFSTLLNKEYCPQILLIDNIAMHVELGRHLDLIETIKESLPGTQIFATTHSYYIKKFGNKSNMYDLRMRKVKGLMKQQPWRIYLKDEIKEHALQVASLPSAHDTVTAWGYDLLQRCENDENSEDLTKDAISFMHKVVGLSVRDLVKYYKH